MAGPEEILARQPASRPPDWEERHRALDPAQSFLVQAPAGSGKTYLLTQRFLRLLAQAEKPDEIVAITFTNAAAAEMRSRILGELEKAETSNPGDVDGESMDGLARRALVHSRRMGWELLDQPGQLRITTIDAFCRSLALQSPLSWGVLSGLGGKLDPVNNPKELYRRAARRTLAVLEGGETPERASMEAVLEWRDNHWKDVEDLIAEMLGVRNRWYQEFVFARDGDWDRLRERLEAPFCRAACTNLLTLRGLLDALPGSREFALDLARAACEMPGKFSPLDLAERAELPLVFSADGDTDERLLLRDAVDAYRALAGFLLTSGREWRKKGGLNVNHGFPAGPVGKAQKERFGDFVEGLAQEPGLREALAAFLGALPLGFTDDEWELMQHCFTVLRSAAVQLQMVFTETGSVDFTEVAQIALRVLAEEDGRVSDFAIWQADGIRHLLVDEFQDTSRSQHQLISRLIAAWPEREGRSCFCVGDPMQSIYGFREAEVELFERTKTQGLDTTGPDPDSLPFRFEPIRLRANFRTVPSLVNDLNTHFERVFAEDDGSGVRFSSVEAARESTSTSKTELHLAFTRKGDPMDAHPEAGDPERTRQAQLAEMVDLIRGKLAAAKGREQYRIAVLGRTKASVIRIAEALLAAGIGFRAIDLVPLRERPEVVDALSLMRALLNSMDRTAWLGVLRAPWCGLSLEELHLLTSADEAEVSGLPVPVLMRTRLESLRGEGRIDARVYEAAERVRGVLEKATADRASAGTLALGTWIETVWKALGGDDCVDRGQQENMRLLWAALDQLPEGELDLLGPAMDAALEDLCAQPDPQASSEFGVQLMTIHKSKGLEFEVVIVPDLEAEGKKFDRSLLSWLERGLADGEDGELTEFLIAPIQSKGEDSGDAKRWVDGVKRVRATQELRRLLYVAATRAREELHLFARPRFSVSRKTGAPELLKAGGLLATGRPAFEETIEARFAAWLEELQGKANPALVASLAAASAVFAEASNLLEMPSGSAASEREVRPTVLRRLPQGYRATRVSSVKSSGSYPSGSSLAGVGTEEPEPLFARIEGGLESRALGKAVHGLLERLTRLFATGDMNATQDWDKTLKRSQAGVVAAMRSEGLPASAAVRLAAQALAVVRGTLLDPVGAWILAPHPLAGVELRWTGMVKPSFAADDEPVVMRNLRPDRVFFDDGGVALRPIASAAAKTTGPVWWIIDYKTSAAQGANLTVREERERFLAQHREQHLGQLAAYAQVLRGLQGAENDGAAVQIPLRICAGLYYPRLQIFDFWEE